MLYQRKRALLTDDVLESLELAEEEILINPSHRLRRDERPDGTVVDRNERGLMVAYIEADDGAIEFVDFLDLWSRPTR